MIDPNDPTASAVRGAVEGALEWTAERIAQLVARINGHSAAASADPIRLESVRRASKSEEAKFLKTYLTDPTHRRVVDDGLTLHDLGGDAENYARLQGIRSDLYHSLGTKGLRGAEIVERGVLGLLIRHMSREGRSKSDITASSFALLESVERWTFFVQASDLVAEVISEVKLRVLANQPAVFAVLGAGNQIKKASKVVESVVKKLPHGFGAETHQSDREYVAFICRQRDGKFELTIP